MLNPNIIESVKTNITTGPPIFFPSSFPFLSSLNIMNTRTIDKKLNIPLKPRELGVFPRRSRTLCLPVLKTASAYEMVIAMLFLFLLKDMLFSYNFF